MEETAAFKKRPLKEILELVLNEFLKGRSIGICSCVFKLLNEDKISGNECTKVNEFLNENKPEGSGCYNYINYPFWFGEDEREKRIEFLEKLIEQSKPDQDE